MTAKTSSMMSEIDLRLANSDWDRMIAGRVLSRRRTILKKRIVASLVLPAAALVLIAVNLFLSPDVPTVASREKALETFVSTQVEGTHKEVFKGSPISLNVAESSHDDLDSFILQTLAQR